MNQTLTFIIKLVLFVLLWHWSSCTPKDDEGVVGELPPIKLLDTNEAVRTIAFGSCNKQDYEQPIWEFIAQNNPDLWIWLGDIVYGDTEDMAILKSKYDAQKSNLGYRNLLANCPTIGIWDDHDYGINDGGKEYSMKKESRDLLLDFLDVSPTTAVRQRAGAYQAYDIGTDGKKVKIILLDARYFRDALTPDTISAARYFPNDTGDILGEEQWQWLEAELKNSDAQVHLIGSGIQMIAEEHIFEKWANFPKARTRLLNLLENIKPPNLLLISGDRHIAEVAKFETDSSVVPIYEFTTSGLTHSYEAVSNEPNKWRISPLVGEKNFGVLRINWDATPAEMTIELRGLNNVVYYSKQL